MQHVAPKDQRKITSTLQHVAVCILALMLRGFLIIMSSSLFVIIFIYLCLQQVSFIDYIIYPLWETWAELVYPDAQPIIDHLSKTREYWSSRSVNSPMPSEEDEDETDKDKEPVPVNEVILSPTIEDVQLQSPAASIRRYILVPYKPTHPPHIPTLSLKTAHYKYRLNTEVMVSVINAIETVPR